MSEFAQPGPDVTEAHPPHLYSVPQFEGTPHGMSAVPSGGPELSVVPQIPGVEPSPVDVGVEMPVEASNDATPEAGPTDAAETADAASESLTWRQRLSARIGRMAIVQLTAVERDNYAQLTRDGARLTARGAKAGARGASKGAQAGARGAVAGARVGARGVRTGARVGARGAVAGARGVVNVSAGLRSDAVAIGRGVHNRLKRSPTEMEEPSRPLSPEVATDIAEAEQRLADRRAELIQAEGEEAIGRTQLAYSNARRELAQLKNRTVPESGRYNASTWLNEAEDSRDTPWINDGSANLTAPPMHGQSVPLEVVTMPPRPDDGDDEVLPTAA